MKALSQAAPRASRDHGSANPSSRPSCPGVWGLFLRLSERWLTEFPGLLGVEAFWCGSYFECWGWGLGILQEGWPSSLHCQDCGHREIEPRWLQTVDPGFWPELAQNPKHPPGWNPGSILAVFVDEARLAPSSLHPKPVQPQTTNQPGEPLQGQYKKPISLRTKSRNLPEMWSHYKNLYSIPKPQTLNPKPSPLW